MVGVADVGRERRRARRRTANLLNGSTAAGLWLARRHGVRVRPGPHGLWLAPGYPRRFPAPHASAVCVGDVVLLRSGAPDAAGVDVMDDRPRLLDHESRHADQWARWCGVVGFLPAYGLASLWSWLRTGDPHSANAFEQAAGLDDGGYRVRPLRPQPFTRKGRAARAARRRVATGPTAQLL